MFSIVKDFFANLYDMDFLSMLDNADFYNKKVSVKRFYWQKLFSVISQFVALKNKFEKDALARAMKEVTYWRLGMVSTSSFKRFFMKKFHSNRDTILNRLKELRLSLRAHLDSSIKTKKQKKSKIVKQHYVVEEIPVTQFIKDNKLKSFLELIEATYSGEIVFNTDKAEKSAYYPPTVAGSLGLIEFDELNKEKFAHEISHLLYDCNEFARYNLESPDDEYHDRLFWHINTIVLDAIENGDFSDVLSSVSNARPWNVESEEEENIIIPDRIASPTYSNFSEEGNIGIVAPIHFDGPPVVELHQNDSQFRFQELGYENYRDPFGFTAGIFPVPENNRGRSRSPGFRTRGVRRQN